MRRAGAVAGVAFVLLTATGCPGTNLDREVEIAEAQHDIEGERLDAEAYGPTDAERAAAVEEARRTAARAFEAARVADAAATERLRRAQGVAGVQALFERGWSSACEQIAATPRASGEVVSYDDCMALLEVTDVASAEEAEGFGAFMAEYAVSEHYGP